MEFTVEEIVEMVTAACADKKAKDIIVIDVREKTVVADYMIICSGKSVPQVKAIANNIDDEIAKKGLEPIGREGIAEGRWAVIDYGSVVAHIFNDENRLLYCLEDLWSNGTNVTKYEYED